MNLIVECVLFALSVAIVVLMARASRTAFYAWNKDKTEKTGDSLTRWAFMTIVVGAVVFLSWFEYLVPWS